MFGLQNFHGSCWVNSALQSLFSCPSLEERYENNNVDKENPYDICLESIYRNKGQSGLKEFFECVKTSYLPAGENIGDAHELIVHLCDKIPWLDKEFRYQVGDQISCKHCEFKEVKNTSRIDLQLTPSKPNIPLLQAIVEHIQPYEIEDWKCEKCNNKGCSKQVLFGSFPKVLMIWSVPIDYSSLLVLNGKKYYLFAVICYNSRHWWTYARKLPPGKPWYVLNDTDVRAVSSSKFPVDRAMRVLLYFLYEN